MPDFTSVPTVELLTRAADAAGRVAEWATGGPWELDMIQPDMAGRHEYYVRGPRELGPQRHVLNARMTTGNAYLIAASGPDHWRAVEALLRAVIKEHSPVTVYSDSRRLDSVRVCKTCGGSDAYFEQSGTPAMRMAAHPCPTLKASRPLAEQVLQHLGDTA